MLNKHLLHEALLCVTSDLSGVAIGAVPSRYRTFQIGSPSLPIYSFLSRIPSYSKEGIYNIWKEAKVQYEVLRHNDVEKVIFRKKAGAFVA